MVSAPLIADKVGNFTVAGAVYQSGEVQSAIKAEGFAYQSGGSQFTDEDVETIAYQSGNQFVDSEVEGLAYQRGGTQSFDGKVRWLHVHSIIENDSLPEGFLSFDKIAVEGFDSNGDKNTRINISWPYADATD